MSVSNVRSVLEYVPYFRGRLFVVHVATPLLESEELVDALLDLDVLHEIGVRLILVAEGDQGKTLYEESRLCEMRSAWVESPLVAGEGVRSRVEEILRRNQIPIVASGVTGTFDSASVSMATELKADKYIALLEEGQVPTRDKSPIHAILERDVASISGDVELKELLEEAAEVCRRGVPRVHLLNGRNRGVLVDELFSEEGVGTMVHTDSYREIRALKEEDIPELLSMIARSVINDELVDRSYEDIHDRLKDYYVLTLDDSIIGCVAVYPYPEQDAAELGCLYIKRSHEGKGYGRSLCEFAEQKACELGMHFIFALSQSAVYYFRDRLHYAEYERATLPPQRLSALEKSGRHSGVFGRKL